MDNDWINELLIPASITFLTCVPAIVLTIAYVLANIVAIPATLFVLRYC